MSLCRASCAGPPRNKCLTTNRSIERDLGDNLAVLNGNGNTTVISFDHTVPSPVAFFHAFVMYCFKGNNINTDAGWISLGRHDQEPGP